MYKLKGKDIATDDAIQTVNLVHYNDFAGSTLVSKDCLLLHKHITNDMWIIYTGATSHMCRNKILLHDIKHVNTYIPVLLPDGSE